MGSLKKDMKKYFQTTNLYELLLIAKDASSDDIKRAYRKLSLQVHPDRVSTTDKETATAKFQVLAKVHSVLSDKKKRKTYDETGIADDDLVSDKISDWSTYFQGIFKKVELADIEAFEKEYIGSDEERNDVKNWYLRFKGDMNKMLEYLMFYKIEHEPRYHSIIQEFIKSKEVPDYERFTNEDPKSVAARRKKCEAEEKRAEKEAAKRKKQGKDDGDLMKMIQDRNQQRMGNLVEDLANRYGGEKEKKTVEEASGSDDDDWEGMSGDEIDESDEDDSGGDGGSSSEDIEDDDPEESLPKSKKAAAAKFKHPAPKTKSPATKRVRK